MKKLFKIELLPTEDGLELYTCKFIALHETECYWYCLSELEMILVGKGRRLDGETKYECAKRRKIKLKRIHKTASRFAFDTEEKAYRHLVLLKKRQVGHLKRSLNFVTRFLAFDEKHGLDSELFKASGAKTIPDTRELVHEHLVFD